jgi:hypothetical protein
MKSRYPAILALGATIAFGVTTGAQTELQQSLKDTEVASHWIYDDFNRALAEAKTRGKPILALFRCVP